MNDLDTAFRQLTADERARADAERKAVERRRGRQAVCDHHYVYLRQGTSRPAGPDDVAKPVYWYFCDRCLEHRGVSVE